MCISNRGDIYRENKFWMSKKDIWVIVLVSRRSRKQKYPGDHSIFGAMLETEDSKEHDGSGGAVGREFAKLGGQKWRFRDMQDACRINTRSLLACAVRSVGLARVSRKFRTSDSPNKNCKSVAAAEMAPYLDTLLVLLSN